MFRGPLLICFIINIRTSSSVIDDLYDTGKQVWKLYTISDSMELDISHDARANEELASDEVMIREMKRQVDEVNKQLNELEKSMGPKKIRDAIESWPLDALTDKDIDTIGLFILSIDEYYEKFHQAIHASDYSPESFETLSREIFLNIEGNIVMIRKLVVDAKEFESKPQNLVAAIANFVAIKKADICGTPQVISNIAIQLFRMIIIAEIKTSIMFAYGNFLGYMENKNKERWQRFNSLAREKFEEQCAIYIETFSLNMAVMDAAYNRACDPPGGNWIRGKSCYELEKTIRTTIFSYNSDYCKWQSCNFIKINQPPECPPSYYGRPAPRNLVETVAECAYLGRIQACILKSGPYQYQYVDSTELGFLGRNSQCPKNNGQLIGTSIRADGTYAACVCNSYSNYNKISLLMIGSNVQSNRVITGLRFVRKKEVLYIQPREGTLGPNGYINPYSQRWIPIPVNINSSLIEPINKENSVFFLDDVILAANYVLTGMKFNKVTRGSVSGFAIEIFGTHFNYRTGKLFLGEDFRRSWKGSNGKSGKSLSFNPVSSVFTTMVHTVTPSDTKYVSLERSTLKDDFGQSTLPLFDAVPITFEVPSALGGVGIFHKGVKDYAGLISLRLYGIEYEKYFKDFKLSHIINGRVLFNSSFH